MWTMEVIYKFCKPNCLKALCVFASTFQTCANRHQSNLSFFYSSLGISHSESSIYRGSWENNDCFGAESLAFQPATYGALYTIVSC